MIAENTLADLLLGSPYVSYSYSYPHKTAYRVLNPAMPLNELWARERRDALFLYMHVPFCEMRCGFCNLFTTVNPNGDFVTDYLGALERQARRVRATLGDAHFARFAIGGGTPTFLTSAELARVFDIAERMYGIDLQNVPISIETSPGTAEQDKLLLLRERGVDRVSIGVQSFIEAEAHAGGRPQKTAEVEAALGRIKATGFPTLNVDLIYGLPGQTPVSWEYSLRQALRFAPEELYLYPLYTRPLTGLARTNKEWDDDRLELYRAGREFLLGEGYEQISMRMFRAPHAPEADGPVYCCQEDGMVGLGCGARSYTSGLHYSSEYAVSARGVRSILADYVGRDTEFSLANYGYRLDDEDRRRRYVIQSLLQVEGLSLSAYQHSYGAEATTDLPELRQLVSLGLATEDSGLFRLTEAGVERSDTIGPWLYSSQANQFMSSYELR